MNRKNMISHAMEDYLKAIFELSDRKKKVSTSKLARRMECTPASVTNMLQKLASLKLVEYTPYHGVNLTEAGKKVALEVLRHHRLIELYLSEVLGYPWDRVHAEADALEHVISEEFEARIDEALGYPQTDPHGAPIPTKDGHMPKETALTLWEGSDGRDFRIKRIDDKNPEALRYLADLGIYPDVRVKFLRRAPFNGPVHILLASQEHSLSKELASQIFVAPLL